MPKMPMPGRNRQAATKNHAATRAAPQPKTQAPRSRDATQEAAGARMDRILRQEQAEAMSGLAYSSMRELEAQGLFPARVKLPGNRVGWRALEIQDWIAALPQVGSAA